MLSRLLEEAENERMHLLTFMKTFPPGPVTRSIVFVTQFGFAAIFASMYILSPRVAHRAVGYIEEMAVVTYCNVIDIMRTPGTQLHTAWGSMPAPEIAKTYWRLREDADMLEVFKQIAVRLCLCFQMLASLLFRHFSSSVWHGDFTCYACAAQADETNHRDVNHTFASMARTDPNPYVGKHHKDANQCHTFWHEKATEGKDVDYLMNPVQRPKTAAS